MVDGAVQAVIAQGAMTTWSMGLWMGLCRQSSPLGAMTACSAPCPGGPGVGGQTGGNLRLPSGRRGRGHPPCEPRWGGWGYAGSHRLRGDDSMPPAVEQH